METCIEKTIISSIQVNTERAFSTEVEIEDEMSSDIKSRRNQRNKRVLLVEDDAIIQIINKSFLEMLGYEVDLARNGREALNLYSEKHDLVLLDIGLPDINGYEVCQAIRQRVQGKRLPILALTAFGEFVEDQCLAAGINEVAIKPMMKLELKEFLERWLPAPEAT